jgi:acyl carrier protein
MDTILDIISSITNLDIAFLKEHLDSENLWNSFTMVEIFLTIEEEYGIRLDDSFKSVKTINQLVKVVEEKAGL